MHKQWSLIYKKNCHQWTQFVFRIKILWNQIYVYHINREIDDIQLGRSLVMLYRMWSSQLYVLELNIITQLFMHFPIHLYTIHTFDWNHKCVPLCHLASAVGRSFIFVYLHLGVAFGCDIFISKDAFKNQIYSKKIQKWIFNN